MIMTISSQSSGQRTAPNKIALKPHAWDDVNPFKVFFDFIAETRSNIKKYESPLLEVDLRRLNAIQIVDAHSRRTMVRNCIESPMKGDANLLASRFLHPLGIICTKEADNVGSVKEGN